MDVSIPFSYIEPYLTLLCAIGPCQYVQPCGLLQEFNVGTLSKIGDPQVMAELGQEVTKGVGQLMLIE